MIAEDAVNNRPHLVLVWPVTDERTRYANRCHHPQRQCRTPPHADAGACRHPPVAAHSTPRADLPGADPGEIDGLAATEVALDGLDTDVTHLRCGYFFTNLLLDVDSLKSGRLQTVLPVDAPMAWVAPRDIAEVAALTLLNREWTGHRVQAVQGPEDLSWSQVAGRRHTDARARKRCDRRAGRG